MPRLSSFVLALEGAIFFQTARTGDDLIGACKMESAFPFCRSVASGDKSQSLGEGGGGGREGDGGTDMTTEMLLRPLSESSQNFVGPVCLAGYFFLVCVTNTSRNFR